MWVFLISAVIYDVTLSSLVPGRGWLVVRPLFTDGVYGVAGVFFNPFNVSRLMLRSVIVFVAKASRIKIC